MAELKFRIVHPLAQGGGVEVSGIGRPRKSSDTFSNSVMGPNFHAEGVAGQQGAAASPTHTVGWKDHWRTPGCLQLQQG